VVTAPSAAPSPAASQQTVQPRMFGMTQSSRACGRECGGSPAIGIGTAGTGAVLDRQARWAAMKAAVATRYGPPEVVRVMDVPRPTPEADELLVRVRATTVNRTDCGFRAAHPWFIRGFTGLAKPRRTILGNEFAGIVDAVGQDVSRFAVGDRVFGYDDTRFGGHA